MAWWLLRDWVKGAARAAVLILGDHGSRLASRSFRVGYIRRSWIDSFPDYMSRTSWFQMKSARGKTNHHPDRNVLSAIMRWWHVLDGDASTWANGERPRGDSGRDTTIAPFIPLMMSVQKRRDKNVVFSKVSFSLHNVTTRVTSPKKGIHDELHPRNLCQWRVVLELGTIRILFVWGS